MRYGETAEAKAEPEEIGRRSVSFFSFFFPSSRGTNRVGGLFESKTAKTEWEFRKTTTL